MCICVSACPEDLRGRTAAQYSLVLHHVHDDPVRGVDVLPDEIFEHDECFHEEILEEEQRGKSLQKEFFLTPAR